MTQKSAGDKEEEVQVINIEEEEAEEATLHGVANPTKVKQHVQFLDKMIEAMAKRIKDDEIKDVMREAVEQFR